MSQNFPRSEFEGTVILRGDPGYEDARYQYAASSLGESIIQPAAIIKAAGDKDVKLAIRYAKQENIALSVRTGGHQYCGASSTNGHNIQLDLSKTYTEFTFDNADCSLVTFGISSTLGDFSEKLKAKGRFIPHGDCRNVNLGGHVQTGGYGMLGRSFGLLADHIQKFRIITANCQDRWVHRDVDDDKDLFYAVLGGSPGNFGVITTVTLRVFRDEDYPLSRGFRAVYPLHQKNLKALLDIMVDMAQDENFPADFDYCANVLSESQTLCFTETYDSKHNHDGHLSNLIYWCPLIVVFVQWANLEGAGQKYDPSFLQKFKDIKCKLVLDDKEHTPMSVLSGHWVAHIEREYNLPYIKRTVASNSTAQRLKENRWTEWISNRIHDITPKFSLSAQFQHFGGLHSRFYQNGKDHKTSYSWRDSRLIMTCDAFYYGDRQHKLALEWQTENDKKLDLFTTQDRRLLWGSHDLDLSANHKYYYDNVPEGKYDRLCRIKHDVDPSGVFTPNRFCIGLPPLPAPDPKPVVPERESLMERLTDIESVVEETVISEFTSLEREIQLREEEFWREVNKERQPGGPIPLWEMWRV